METGAINEDTEMRRMETIEEGQAEEGEDMDASINDMLKIKKEYKRTGSPSKLIQIIYYMEKFLNYF